MAHLALFTGPWELILIFAVILLVFGARRLPQLARSMGSSITQFKHGLKEQTDLLQDGKQEDEPSGEAEAPDQREKEPEKP